MVKELLVLGAIFAITACSSTDSISDVVGEESSNTNTLIDGAVLGTWTEVEPWSSEEWCDTVTFYNDSMVFSEDQYGSAVAVYGSDSRDFFAVDGLIGNTFSGYGLDVGTVWYEYEREGDTLLLYFANPARVETSLQKFVKE